jgi:hypothetical protein
MTGRGGRPENGPPIVPWAGAGKNFASAKRGDSRNRLDAGAKIVRTNRAKKVRVTTTTCSSGIAIGCRSIATASPTSGNGTLGAVRASRPRVIATTGIGFVTVKPMNRGRNLFRLATVRMNGIAIVKMRANGNRATKQNGVLATAIEISGALTLRHGAIATEALTIPIG